MAPSCRKIGKQAEMKAELEKDQKLRTREPERSSQHADTSAIGSAGSTNERPDQAERWTPRNSLPPVRPPGRAKFQFC